jgi:hypothetical protein
MAEGPPVDCPAVSVSRGGKMKPRLTPERVKGLRYVLKLLDRDDIRNDPKAPDDLVGAAEYLQELVDWWDVRHTDSGNERKRAWFWNRRFGVWIKDGSAESNGQAQ